MKLSGITASFAFTAALLSVPAAAQSAADWEWYAAEADNKAYSVEVPCSPEQIAEDTAVDRMSNHMQFDRGTSVVCVRNGMLFVAGIRSAPLPDGTDFNMYDMIVSQTDGFEKEGLEKGPTIISGRRALISRETREDGLASTVIVEMGPGSILMALIGGPMADEGVAVEDVAPMIDRYIASLEVAP